MSRAIAYVLTKAGHGKPIGAVMTVGNRDWHLHPPEWRPCSMRDAPLLAGHAYRFGALINQESERVRITIESTALHHLVVAARIDGLNVGRSFEVDGQDFHTPDEDAFALLLYGVRPRDSAEPTVA